MLGAIAEGVTRIRNYATGADCGSTLACLRGLGVALQRQGNGVAIVGGALRAP